MGVIVTSLVAWVGADSRGPASFYFASDSRISWQPSEKWDFARKLFASSRHPDILGYYGDVLFSSQDLSQVIDLVDADNLFDADATPELKFEEISTIFKKSYSTYPEKYRSRFAIIHCSRCNSGMSASFKLFELSWESVKGWQSREVQVPSKSGIVTVYGSGSERVKAWVERWNATKAGRTSRSVFSAFCDSLSSGGDPATGGAPQLVGVYRQGPAETFGVIYDGKRFLHGLCVDEAHHLDAVEWRNELFERCDWTTGLRLPGAQRHARPHIQAEGSNSS